MAVDRLIAGRAVRLREKTEVVSFRDVCPDTGLARLSYGQARAPLDGHTAVRGPGTGWDLRSTATPP
jgi:hypothetical protein